MSRKHKIIERLKENGCWITKQRKILIDIILENDCASCKEIFYKASQEDDRRIDMSVVIIGGHDRMVCQYKKICRQFNCKAKVFTQMSDSCWKAYSLIIQ